jgi:hypothetical protein
MNANKTKLLLLIAASLFAQDVTFKSDVRLVVVNVSVRDRAGNLVTNLTKEDFELLEDNVKQKIQVFELQNLNNELLTPASFANSNAREPWKRKLRPSPRQPHLRQPLRKPARSAIRTVACWLYSLT